MHKQMKRIAFSLVLIAATANAQTNVTTTGGTANTLPVFTGSATVGNSVIWQSNGKIGINISNPAQSLDVVGILHVSGAANPTTSIQGAYLGWNASGGNGETNFINNQGLGPGGFAFMNTPSSGTPMSTLMFIEGAGNVGIGTTSPGARLEVNGNIRISSGSGGSITFADGTVQTSAFTGATTGCGGDYAESVDVSGARTAYEPGDVLVISAEAGSDVSKSVFPYSTLVAGIYSTRPGVIGRRQTTDRKVSKTEVPMAMVGIVPTKVSAENGSIRRGDLLVTSSIAGYAMKGTDRNLMLGAVLGKALGNLESGTGVIEVMVTLQ